MTMTNVESTEPLDGGEQKKTDGIDLEMMWVTWACPACELVAEQHIGNVGFAFDMDLTVDLDGNCKAYLNVICPHCSGEFRRELS